MGLHSDIATRLGGSADLYERTGRLPSASINFITAHDGFTLNDLVSYNHKHNEANKDDNRDGTDDNNSWNCGHEGPTDEEAIVALRERQKRNYWASLMLSQGVPMICAGDEVGRTQHGNNNSYCQDNEISWFNWHWNEKQKSLLAFAQRVIRLRRDHPNFRRRSFHEKDPAVSAPAGGVKWFRSDGREMQQEDWENGGWMRTLGMLLPGNAAEIRDSVGRNVVDNDFLLLLNAHQEAIEFRFPEQDSKGSWSVTLNTASEPMKEKTPARPRKKFRLEAFSFALLSRPQTSPGP
jgi:glycogen operon protein